LSQPCHMTNEIVARTTIDAILVELMQTSNVNTKINVVINEDLEG
jgi:hypothetical protein